MAVVVEVNEEGSRVYRSVNGIDISPEEREHANKLDISIKESLQSLESEFQVSKQEKVSMYWQLGYTLRSLMCAAKLIAAEQPYFFLNVKCRAPEGFKFKDRGPGREHFYYCYRLAGYPKKIAELLQWGQWSYLFDSSGINSEPRFDQWFTKALSEEPNFFNRRNVRLLGKVLNSFFVKMETGDLSDIEINRCFDAAKSFCKDAESNDDESLTKRALASLKKNRMVLAQILEGRMPGSALFSATTKC